MQKISSARILAQVYASCKMNLEIFESDFARFDGVSQKFLMRREPDG